jgi:glycosyltransferase involved in cell wall biosynthesis
VNLSVVVPAFNEEKLIDETLGAIHRARAVLTAAGWFSEVIVCDNNSTDRTAELSGKHGARVIFEPVNQIGRARNTGAAAATGAWLLFIDADSQPTPELFRDLLETIQSGNCLAGGCTVQMNENHGVARLAVQSWNRISRLMKWAPGSFIFCETDTFRRLGGFNLEWYASEEIDLFRRLKREARRSGRRIVILHRHPLLTSGRKLHLYSTREHLRFLWRAVLLPRRTLKDPRTCFTWYDGRR